MYTFYLNALARVINAVTWVRATLDRLITPRLSAPRERRRG